MRTAGGGVNRCGQQPSAEVMLAGTLSLMTGYGRQADGGVRTLMARRIVSNLSFLAEHPQLSVRLRGTLSHLRRHWQWHLGGLTCEPAAPAPAPAQRPLWHDAHEVVQ